jgi:hypothetical protein
MDKSTRFAMMMEALTELVQDEQRIQSRSTP